MNMGASDTDQAEQTQDDEKDQQTVDPEEVAVSEIRDEPREIDVDDRLEETRSEDDDDREMTEKPEVTDEHREQAKEIIEPYQEDRETVTLPGSGNTVAGTAINDWLDEDGNPKYSDESGDDSDSDSKNADSKNADSKNAESKDADSAEKQRQEQHS